MGCAGTKAAADEVATKPDPGSVDMRGKPPEGTRSAPTKADLNAAAEIIQSAALGSPEPAPAASASSVTSQKDAERYDPIVATQVAAIAEVYKLLDVNHDGQLQASELMTVVSQYTGLAFKENDFFSWYEKHGASRMQGVDGQVSLKEFGWYMADVALTFGEGDEAKAALATVINAFKKLASGRKPLLVAIFKELDVTNRHAPCGRHHCTHSASGCKRTTRPGFDPGAAITVAQRQGRLLCLQNWGEVRDHEEILRLPRLAREEGRRDHAGGVAQDHGTDQRQGERDPDPHQTRTRSRTFHA